MSRAYYNEFDPYAAQWLRNLIDTGHIAKGDVDERSIVDVTPSDLEGYTQCHFFAGIGIWSYALRQAGWPDDREVWTGSAPCQPFSAAGKGKGTKDERHLWPEFFRLIRSRRPSVVFGEQVASKGGLAWLDDVSADLESANYAVGSVDTCAAGFGAPHIRQRLYWVADARSERLERSVGGGHDCSARDRFDVAECGTSSGLADAADIRRNGHQEDNPRGDRPTTAAGRSERIETSEYGESAGGCSGLRSPVGGFWRTAEWLYCRDDKWRSVEPGTFPLADGPPSKVGRLRAYGNAIVAPQAQAIIEAYMDVRGLR